MARPQHISDDTITKALAAAGEATAAEVADVLGMGPSTAAKRLAALEGAGAVRRHPGGRVNGTRVADRWSVPAVPVRGENAATAETGAPEPAEPSAAGERLGRGALGTLVREYLAAHPDEDLGAHPGGQGARSLPGSGVQCPVPPGGGRRGSAGQHHAPPVPHRLRPLAAARSAGRPAARRVSESLADLGAPTPPHLGESTSRTP